MILIKIHKKRRLKKKDLIIMSKYLLEIGTEELPYKFIDAGQEQLKAAFEKLLKENEIGFSSVKTYGTPRRLTVIIDGLNEKQPDTVKTVRGPIANIAFDENGNLTQAGLGFARKNGVEPSALYKEDNYVHAKIEKKGKLTRDVLAENIENLVLKMQGPYFMRWAGLDVKFQRPVRWVVSLFDNDELKIKIADVESSRFSRGHRFASSKVEIKNPDNYENALFDAKVIVDGEKRKEKIISSAKAEAEKIGAQVVLDEELVKEVTNITEWPVPVVCNFDKNYLNVPEKVTVTVMATHQRYFPLYKDGKLINSFITTTNFLGNDFENIKAGNERVVKARLDDAVFFFNEDTKKPFESNLEGLKGVTFQKGMGSMYDKTYRILELSKYIAKELGKESKTIERTALLCKADLVTSLVFEFTELQGFIGSDYAFNSGEAPQVVQGIKEHYYPLGADSELAESIEGQVVGLADKIDTICAVFAEGKKPTGSADPLGVRRATLGILKTIIQKDLKVNLTELIKKSISILPVKVEAPQKLYEEVKNFFEQRLSIYYNDKYSHDVVEACLSNKDALSDLGDFALRLEVVEKIKKLPEFAPVNEAANRIIRIARADSNSPDKALFNSPFETQLMECITSINADNLEYEKLFGELTKAVPVINEFFDNVLVMDKDEKIKENRLKLLALAKEKFEKLADFSKING